MLKNPVTLAELAKYLNAEFIGDAHCIVHGLAPLDSAKPGEISFFYDSRYRDALANTQASVVILSSKDITSEQGNFILTATPRLAFAKIASLFVNKSYIVQGIHPTVVVGQDCDIHPSVSIAPHCVIGNKVRIGANTSLGAGCTIGDDASLGEDCLLWSRVTLYHNVHIANRVIIQSGAVIGSDGFGFENEAGTWYKIPQLGGVMVGDDVEIGANTTIDRGALKDTVIAAGVKLDNQIQVGHNVVIGAHSIVAGSTAIAGGAHIGKHCMIGGKVGISGHLEIVDGVILTAGTMVSSSILKQGIYSSGIPAHANHEWRKNAVRFMHLDDLARRLRKLEKSKCGEKDS